MVIIDQAENLAPNAAAAHQALAWLTDRLPETTFTYVTRIPAHAVQHAEAALEDAPGPTDRVTALPMPYGPEWERLVADADEQLRLLDHAHGSLSALAGRLHEATGGLAGALGPALRAAAADAVGSTEHLTWEALEHALTRSP
nr:hypothetical protein OG781_44330 [Streptomyces sp. NBC_00830]